MSRLVSVLMVGLLTATMLIAGMATAAPHKRAARHHRAPLPLIVVPVAPPMPPAPPRMPFNPAAFIPNAANPYSYRAPLVTPGTSLPLPRDMAIDKQPRLDKFYPKSLRKAGTEGVSLLVLAVDVRGRVTNCQSHDATAVGPFDAAGCALARKLRFVADAHAFAGTLPLRIEWKAAGVSLVRAVDPVAPQPIMDGTAFTENDYPHDAIRNEQEGPTTVQVDVGADGIATGCAITASSGSLSLDQQTCRVFMRMRFQPGRNEFGIAVVKSIFRRVHWVLPREDAPPTVPTVPATSPAPPPRSN